ncbi:MAG: hypothetical protein JWP71_681 [Mucilaginibacter sp.]|nr:hypothetical protein [Mucilaginibacter sp.]
MGKEVKQIGKGGDLDGENSAAILNGGEYSPRGSSASGKDGWNNRNNQTLFTACGRG